MGINRHLKPEIQVPEFKPFELPFDQLYKGLMARQQAYDTALKARADFEGLMNELGRKLAPADLPRYEEEVSKYQEQLQQLQQELEGDLSAPGTIRRITDIASDFAQNATFGPIGTFLRTGQYYNKSVNKILEQPSDTAYQTMQLLKMNTQGSIPTGDGSYGVNTFPVGNYIDIGRYVDDLAQEVMATNEVIFDPNIGYVLLTQKGQVPLYQYLVERMMSDPKIVDQAAIVTEYEKMVNPNTKTFTVPIYKTAGDGAEMKQGELIFIGDPRYLTNDAIKDRIRTHFSLALRHIYSDEPVQHPPDTEEQIPIYQQYKQDLALRSATELGLNPEDVLQNPYVAKAIADVSVSPDILKDIIASIKTEQVMADLTVKDTEPADFIKQTALVRSSAVGTSLFYIGGAGGQDKLTAHSGPVTGDSFPVYMDDSSFSTDVEKDSEDMGSQVVDESSNPKYDIENYLKEYNLDDNSIEEIMDILSARDLTKDWTNWGAIPDLFESWISDMPEEKVKAFHNLYNVVFDDEKREIIDALAPGLKETVDDYIKQVGLDKPSESFKTLNKGDIYMITNLTLAGLDIYRRAAEGGIAKIFRPTKDFLDDASEALLGTEITESTTTGRTFRTSGIQSLSGNRDIVVVDSNGNIKFKGKFEDLNAQLKEEAKWLKDDPNVEKAIESIIEGRGLGTNNPQLVGYQTPSAAHVGGLVWNLSGTLNNVKFHNVKIIIPWVPKEADKIHEAWKSVKNSGVDNVNKYLVSDSKKIEIKDEDGNKIAKYKVITSSKPISLYNEDGTRKGSFMLVGLVNEMVPVSINIPQEDEPTAMSLPVVEARPIEYYYLPAEQITDSSNSKNPKYKLHFEGGITSAQMDELIKDKVNNMYTNEIQTLVRPVMQADDQQTQENLNQKFKGQYNQSE